MDAEVGCDGEGDGRIFTRRFPPRAGGTGPLAGLRVSIKELFDVEGHPTHAGTNGLRPAIATKDAEAVARLRAAGAELVGHTSMTELAYSGLGLNPHSGTPDNPLRPGSIPGGSTSGGAVSVARGFADAALGTDTGGSLRIPAAFCGLVGFKPTASSVPRGGAVPLSRSLDSIGPMAADVETCARVWRVLAARVDASAEPVGQTPLLVPTNFGRTETAPSIEAAFEAALGALRGAGFPTERRTLPSLDAYGRHPVWHYAAVESLAAHPELWERRDRLDPRVASRMARGETVRAVDYARTLIEREALVAAFRDELNGAILVLPTVAIEPPRFSDLEEDAEYDRLNLLCLRNTTLANVLDGCSISLPIGRDAPHGLMLTAPGGADDKLLALAARLEPILRGA